jgi:rRNA processing protein Gar1
MKRSQDKLEEEDREEPVVDDLEIAAAYAMAKYQVASTTDDNEVDLEEEEEEVINDHENEPNEQEKHEPQISTATETEEPSSDSDSEDAESDVDLAENLKSMNEFAAKAEAHDDDDVPKTANEIDGYRASVQQLEQVLGTSLQIDSTATSPQQTHPAGKIQHFLADERIMVVVSLGNNPLLLEEGNLLVLKEPSWIPLGKILEVFGPVSQPLYSIRLPEPVDPSKDDPWSPNGKYTQWIRQNPNTMVHYLPQIAKLLDTHTLLANNRRGCDASNVNDEEILHASDVYYSDDEAERNARKKGRARNFTQSQPIVAARSVAAPGGFHALPVIAPPVPLPPPPPPPPPPEEESDTIYYD